MASSSVLKREVTSRSIGHNSRWRLSSQLPRCFCSWRQVGECL